MICDRNKGDLELVNSDKKKIVNYSDLVEGGIYQFVGGFYSKYGRILLETR
jgi:hypothetical protein